MHKNGHVEQVQHQINDSLSQDLRNELLLAKQGRFFRDVPIFRRIALLSPENSDLLREWALLFKECRFGADQTIFHPNQIAEYLYATVLGEIRLSYPHSHIQAKYCQDSTFGLFKFLLQQTYGYSATTLTYCKISCLAYPVFMGGIRKNRLLYVHGR